MGKIEKPETERTAKRRASARAKRLEDRLDALYEVAGKLRGGHRPRRLDVSLLLALVTWGRDRLREDDKQRPLLVQDFKAALEILTSRQTAVMGVEPWWRHVGNGEDPESERDFRGPVPRPVEIPDDVDDVCSWLVQRASRRNEGGEPQT
jgi:hypothetical protein